MSKKEASLLAAYYGCTTNYSGNKRTMYIHGDNHKEAIIAIKAHYTRFTVSD